MNKYFRFVAACALAACCLSAGCMKYGAPIMDDQKDVFLLPYTKSFMGMPTKSGVMICVPRVDGVKCVDGPEILLTLPCNARDQAILNFCNTTRRNQSAVAENGSVVTEKQDLKLKTWPVPTNPEHQIQNPNETDHQRSQVQTGIQINSATENGDAVFSADCIRICDRFILVMPPSNVRKITRESCLRRCGEGDIDFSVCAWQVQKPEDVQTCMKMPVRTERP